jgi:hypothetical protein
MAVRNEPRGILRPHVFMGAGHPQSLNFFFLFLKLSASLDTTLHGLR